MRTYFLVLGAACWLAGCGSRPAPQSQAAAAEAPLQARFAADAKPGDPPETILIPSKYGDVTFTHRKHFERVKGDCTVCHTKVFPQSLAPLNYKKALHRVAEADRTSCAFCHAVGGSSFAADSNCIRCHAERDYSQP